MIFEYEAEDDAVPVKVVMRFTRPLGEVLVNEGSRVFTALPPAPGASVFVRGTEHGIRSTHWYTYPDSPELDWVEVVLA